MYLTPVLRFAHRLLSDTVSVGDAVMDGTAGNGHDTLLLAKLVGIEGKVWAFDVQEQALQATLGRLKNEGMERQVALILDGHQYAAEYVDQQLAAAVFNFGWLPGSDKSCTTQAQTSIAALDSAVAMLKSGGLLVAVLYPGHEAGREEAAAVETWAAVLPQREYAVLKYGFINQKNRPPYILAVEKLHI